MSHALAPTSENWEARAPAYSPLAPCQSVVPAPRKPRKSRNVGPVVRGSFSECSVFRVVKVWLELGLRPLNINGQRSDASLPTVHNNKTAT